MPDPEEQRAQREKKLIEGLQPEVRLSRETMEHLQGKMQAAVKTAVVELVEEAKKPENTEAFFAVVFDAFFTAARKHAAAKTGSFVLGGIGATLKRFLWVLMIIVALVMAGDWNAVSLAWQAYKAAR